MANIKKTVSTRIILRNDTLENWQRSTKGLLKGEVALALSGDTYEIRVGVDGVKTWNDLSTSLGGSNLVFKSSNITDLIQTINDTETNTNYRLAEDTLLDGETGKSYKLQSKEKGSDTWSDVEGSRFNIPQFDPSTIEDDIKTLSTDLYDNVSADLTSLEAACDTFIGETFPNALTSLSSGLSTYAEQQAAAAKAAGELSAQTVRNDLTGYVQKSDVKTAITETNKVVTENEIKDLSGAMHFIGTATVLDGETPEEALVRTFPTAKKGDVALIDSSGAEYVYVGDTSGIKENWHLIGDEGTYATKAELEAHIDDEVKHITSNERTKWDAKATSADVSAIADAYCGIEEQRATGIEAGLRADIDEVSGSISSFTNEWKQSVDISVANLCAYAEDLAEVDAQLCTAIDNRIKVQNVGDAAAVSSDLTIKEISEEDYMAKVAAGESLISDGILYVMKPEGDYALNAYGHKIVGIDDPTELSDAANKKYVDAEVKKVADNALSAIEINGLEFEIDNNKATLEISSINGGNAEITAA